MSQIKTTQKKTKNIPELRFSGFEGEPSSAKASAGSWEEKKLGDIASFSKGKNLSKKDMDKDGQNKCIHYGELYTEYAEVIKSVVSRTNISKNDAFLSRKNDVLMPTSDVTPNGLATASAMDEEGVILGGDILIIRSDDLVNQFFGYYVSSHRKDIMRLVTGVTVYHIYGSDMKILRVVVPSLPEQQKIAGFLGAVDEWVENLKKQKEKLDQYKKGLMQKIFSQEIRFKDDDGNDFPDWKEKRLGDLAKITTGDSNREDSDTEGKYRFFDRSVEERWTDNYSFNGEALIVSGEGLTFKPRYYKGKFGLHQRVYAVLKDESDLNWVYLYYFVLQNSHWFNRMAVGSTMPSLRMDAFNKMVVRIPRSEEQQKIADFLTSVDEWIELKEKQISAVELWKQGLMQKMFV